MGSKLYVGNLSYQTTEETLRAAFAQDGRVVRSVSILIDRDNGRSRGFGFVEMGSDADAARALQALDGHPVDGRPLRVNEAREQAQEQRPGAPAHRPQR